MGILRLPGLVQTAQPQSGPVQVDWSNPINRGLSYCLDHSGADLISGKRVTLPVTPVKAGLAANLQTNDIDVTASAALALGSEWSIAYSFIPISLSGVFDLFFERNVKADSNHFELYKDSSTGKIALYIVSSAGVLVGGPVLAAGVPVNAIITASAGTLKLYLAGVFVTSVAWAGTIAGTTSWARFNATESGTSNGRQKMLFFRAWNRPLTDVEVAGHYANPWQLFKSPQRVMPTAAGSDVIIALTGQATTAAAGNLVPGIAAAVSGQSTTTAQGSIAPVVAIGLSGQSSSAQQGLLTPTRAIAISGLSSASAAGSVSPSISAALAGQASTTQQGILAPSGNITVALTGQSVSVAQGVLTRSTPEIVFALATIMRQSAIAVQAGTMKSTTAAQGGTLKATIALSTIMRQSQINTRATMTNASINRTVAFI